MARPGYDVAIVGASIAGCTAATLFGRQGLRVALIERENDSKAYKKICTHYIQPSATPTIERLGLKEAIEAAGAIRNSVEFWTRWGWIRPTRDANGPFPSYGYNIRRQKLDPILRKYASNTPGVTFMPGLAARRLIHDDQHFVGVEVEGRDGKTYEIRARLLVAADGRNSTIADLSKIRATIRPNNRFFYFAYYQNLPLSSGTITQFWLLDPDVAAAFPNDEGLTLLGSSITKDKLADFKKDIEKNFIHFFEKLPDGPPIRKGKRVSEILGVIHIPNVSRQVILPGLAFIGDAALVSDPLPGVGIGWAFQSAEWLVDCTARALLNNGDLEHALGRYRKQHRASLAGHHFMIANSSQGRPFGLMEKLLFSAAVKDPGTARHLDAYGARTISPLQFLSPSSLARLLWVNLTRRRG
jgi:flavin-dependent dehydrogenase